MKTSANIPKAPGIYRISIGPRTFYWGQSGNLRARATAHRNYLRRGDHDNQRLQRSYDKYGDSAFTFEVSVLCPVEDLNLQEQLVLDVWHGTPGCANVAKVAEASGRGLKRSEATREKIARAATGQKHSAERRARNSAARTGVPLTRRNIERIRASHHAKHPNILVLHTDGSSDIWPGLNTFAKHLGYTGNATASAWLNGRRPIPAKYNIAAVSRTNRPATINPEAL